MNRPKTSKKTPKRAKTVTRSRRRPIRKESDEESDLADLMAARKALAEPGRNIPWEKVKADLGL